MARPRLVIDAKFIAIDSSEVPRNSAPSQPNAIGRHRHRGSTRREKTAPPPSRTMARRYGSRWMGKEDGKAYLRIGMNISSRMNNTSRLLPLKMARW